MILITYHDEQGEKPFFSLPNDGGQISPETLPY